MTPFPRPRLDARILGALLCAGGLTLLAAPSLLASALAIELLAAAFWCWARDVESAADQVQRWSWLRRPSTALWLAVAIHAAVPNYSHTGTTAGSGPREMLRWMEAIAVLWAGLELMAALPLARPYSDLSGPLPAVGPWLPVLLPSAGFVLLWRHSSHWIDVVPVRHVAVGLLILTALLGALRAFARRQWTASLRWLAVSDSALAGLLVAYRTVSPEAALLLWLAACGGHTFLLAGEMRGSTPRRGPFNTWLWRTACWIALGCLTWPALLAAGFGPAGSLRLMYYAAAAVTTATVGWITIGRMVAAPERRRIMRADASITLSRIGAIMVMITGPIALSLAWWAGFEPPWRESIAALAPVLIGGGAAIAARGPRSTPLWRFFGAIGRELPGVARRSYRLVINVEQWLVGVVLRLFGVITSPLHDLHTGDAQEYLLFLVGLAVLSLVLPLLQ